MIGKIVERYCHKINRNARIKIHVLCEEMPGEIVTTLGPSRCLNNSICNLKDCKMVQEEIEKECGKQKKSIENQQKERKRW